jgi:hypothetical protein
MVDRSQNDILLLVQADKRLEHGEPINAHAQLVAGAVAVFGQNNLKRVAIAMAEKVNHFLSLFALF